MILEKVGSIIAPIVLAFFIFSFDIDNTFYETRTFNSTGILKCKKLSISKKKVNRTGTIKCKKISFLNRKIHKYRKVHK